MPSKTFRVTVRRVRTITEDFRINVGSDTPQGANEWAKNAFAPGSECVWDEVFDRTSGEKRIVETRYEVDERETYAVYGRG